MELELDLQDKQSELVTLKAQAQQTQSGKCVSAEAVLGFVCLWCALGHHSETSMALV